MTLWGGVFQLEPDEAVRKLNDSLPFDWRMADVDITASQAWAGAIHQAGILTQEEYQAIMGGLEAVRAEFTAGAFVSAPGDEDIHTAVERRLTELIGPTAGKLHTGRSRNDQVATDLRLWTMSAINAVKQHIIALQRALIDQADAQIASIMPGFTHFQPAQPITAAHWLLSYTEMLSRDQKRFETVAASTAVSPLGSGALAGTPFAINRESLAETLGMTAATWNSLDAVADRDFVADFLHAAVLLMLHLSRMAEDLIIFSNPRFGFVTLDERYSTGSSLMPQKRNPDPLELARGKTGRIIGHLTGFLTTMKGLPAGYNKDLQEDKEPLFDAFDTLQLLLPVVTAVIRTLTWYPGRMRAALEESMLATDLADYLVLRGIPFRQAHHIAGRVVQRAEALNVPMSALPLADFQAISPIFNTDVFTVFDFDAAVARRSVIGGPAPEAVRRHIAHLRSSLES